MNASTVPSPMPAARQLLADHENTRIIAASHIFRTDRGTLNAQYNSPVRESVDDVVGHLCSSTPTRSPRSTLPPCRFERPSATTPSTLVSRQLYAEFDSDGDDLAADPVAINARYNPTSVGPAS